MTPTSHADAGPGRAKTAHAVCLTGGQRSFRESNMIGFYLSEGTAGTSAPMTKALPAMSRAYNVRHLEDSKVDFRKPIEVP